jgi:hypothetical protein
LAQYLSMRRSKSNMSDSMALSSIEGNILGSAAARWGKIFPSCDVTALKPVEWQEEKVPGAAERNGRDGE